MCDTFVSNVELSKNIFVFFGDCISQPIRTNWLWLLVDYESRLCSKHSGCANFCAESKLAAQTRRVQTRPPRFLTLKPVSIYESLTAKDKSRAQLIVASVQTWLSSDVTFRLLVKLFGILVVWKEAFPQLFHQGYSIVRWPKEAKDTRFGIASFLLMFLCPPNPHKESISGEQVNTQVQFVNDSKYVESSRDATK